MFPVQRYVCLYRVFLWRRFNPRQNIVSISSQSCHALTRYTLGDLTQCVPKSEPPKHFATATPNLHRFKWNFTHTIRHLFLSLLANFIRIPYSVYEILNSFNCCHKSQLPKNTASHSFSFWWLHLPAGQCPSPQCPRDVCATVISVGATGGGFRAIALPQRLSIPQKLTKSPISWLVWHIDRRCLDLLGGFHPLYKTLFFDFWFRTPNAKNLLPKICTKRL